MTVESNRATLLGIFLAAQDYYQWDPERRCNYLASILDFLFNLRELRPDGSSWPSSLEDNWEQMWKPVLTLWLRGCAPDEMIEEEDVAEVTNSPVEVSLLIDDLFGYRAPWGLNALSSYLEEIATEAGQSIPEITSYFSALLKYGVHSPAAGALLAFGLESRKIALKLVEQCSNEAMMPLDLLNWFTRLTKQELTSYGFAENEIKAITEAQEEARQITRMGPRQRRSGNISITISHDSLGKVQEGDTLVLHAQPDVGSSAFALRTLWGDSLGVFQYHRAIPKVWSYPDRIDVTVTKVTRGLKRSLVALHIQEV